MKVLVLLWLGSWTVESFRVPSSFSSSSFLLTPPLIDPSLPHYRYHYRYNPLSQRWYRRGNEEDSDYEETTVVVTPEIYRRRLRLQPPLSPPPQSSASPTTPTPPTTKTSPTKPTKDQNISSQSQEQPVSDPSYNWKDEWYAVTFASHIPNPSTSAEVTSATIFGHALALWRQSNDSMIYCADDRCPHRQAALSQGRVTPDGHLQCHYHGWEFQAQPPTENDNDTTTTKDDKACTHCSCGKQRPTGPAVNIPTLAPSSKGKVSIPKKAGLVMHPVIVQDGVVWVWMGDNDPTRDPPVSVSSRQAPLFHQDQGKRQTVLCHEFQYDIPANHVFVTENLLDPAHIHFVHEGELQGGNKDKAYPLEMDLVDSRTTDGITSRGFAARFRELTPASVEPRPWTNVTFWAPGTVQFRAPSSKGTGVTLVQEIHNTPLTSSMTRQLVRAYIVGLPKLLHLFITMTPKFMIHLTSAKVIEQDIPLLATQEANVLGSLERRSLVNSSNQDLLLGSADKFIGFYRKWLKTFARQVPFAHAVLPQDSSQEVSLEGHLSQWREGHPDISSRYHLHVKHSPITRNALMRVKAAKRVAWYAAAVTCLAMASVRSNLTPAWVSVTRIHQIFLTSILAIPFLHRLERSFFATFDRRDELRRPIGSKVSLPQRLRNWWNNGSNVHMTYLCANAIAFSALTKHGRKTFDSLTVLCLVVTYLGQFVDNAVKALGARLGEGPTLRRLTKTGLILHGAGTPLLAVPISQLAVAHGIFSLEGKTKIITGTVPWLVLSLVEFVQWMKYDSSLLSIVDKRHETLHKGQSLAGTLSYRSGKILECLRPVLLLLAYQIGVGLFLLIKGVGGSKHRQTAILLFGSAMASVLSNSFNRPDIQFGGEALYIWSIYAILLNNAM